MNLKRPAASLLLVGAIAACAAPPSASPSVPAGASASMPVATPMATPTPGQTPRFTPVPSPSAAPPTWSELAVAGGPPAREDHTWTVAEGDAVAYLFGGRDGATVHGDLWAFDLEADQWTAVATDGGPAPRFGHEAVWVEGIGLVVVFGQAGATFFDDVWAFDPVTAAWSQLPSSGEVPLARYGSCAAVAPDGRLWISHGFTSDGTRFADTRAYAFDTGVWADVTPDGEVPVNRCLHGCWWTDAGEFTLYAGQTTGVTALGDRWVLADGSWSSGDGQLPAARNLSARARFDATTLVVGGQGVDGGYLDDGWWLLDDGSDAVPLVAEGQLPPPRAGSEMIVDGDRVLLFGGRNAEVAFADVWELRGVRPPSP